MDAYKKTISRSVDSNRGNAYKIESGSSAQQSKEAWVEHYANQILRLLSAWGSCLGVSRQYLVLLRQELTESYEQPLRKSFIETTYQSSRA